MLRPFCIAALSLAAITSGFSQAKPAPPATSAPVLAPAPATTAPAPATTAPAPATTAPAPPATTTTTTTTTAPATTNPQAAPLLRPLPPAAAASPGQDRNVVLQYPNSDVVDVLRLYETLTGKHLVTDNFVQGKVNIFLSKPLPREDAIKIIEMNLLMNGYSLVPAEGNVVKVIGTGKNPRGAGVPIISDDSDIPQGDHVISYLFKLRYADPIELQQVLGQYLSPPQTFTSFLALPKSSSILVTENSSVIRALVHIIDQVDIPPAEVVSEFIKLERADVTKVVEMLKEVFDKGAQPPTAGVPGVVPPGVKPGVRPVVPGVVPAPTKEEMDLGTVTALSEDSIVVGKIKIAADVRTNRIHVITRPINMPFIRKLIAEFDANVEFAKPIARPLRYISAADILPVLVQSLTEPGTTSAAGPGGGSDTGTTQPPRPRPPSNSGGFDSGSSSGGGQEFAEELSTTAVDTTPKAVTIGNAKIIADQRANAIIILGNREVVVKVMKILDEMDVKAPQVALATVIGELTLNNNEEFGIDYFQRFTRLNPTGNGGAAGVARNTTNAGRGAIPLLDPANLINLSNLGEAAATGGTSILINTGNSLTALVRMLDSSNKFRVISRPMVFTTNNKKAIIASGTEIPVPVNTISQPTTVGGIIPSTNFANSSSIQFKKIALQLEVVPLINSEKEVTLDILQKVDSQAGFTEVSGNAIPNIATRYIKTTVSAPNCATIVLGGLVMDDKTRNVNGIPLLGRIPVIGGLFRSTVKSKNRTELLILMRPEVVLTKLDLYRLRQKTEDKTHFGPELNQDDCPDCPVPGDGKELALPAPDLPGMK